MELIERLRVCPGDRLGLLRSLDGLRRVAAAATVGGEADEEDNAALARLSAENKELCQEKLENEGRNRHLQEEIDRLVNVVRQQDAQLHRAQDRIAELDDLVRTQTEQVDFLTRQLRLVAEREPSKEAELFESYRNTSVAPDESDDWGAAQLVSLPVDPAGTETGQEEAAAVTARPPSSGGASALDTSPRFIQEHDTLRAPAPPPRGRMAQSLDSAKVKECLVGFDVDHIVQCLATAVLNRIILSTARRRPHSTTSADAIRACAVFLEPACREKLLAQEGAVPDLSARASAAGSELGSSLSYCSALMSRASLDGSLSLKDSLLQEVDPLNDIAVRAAPNQWDVYRYLRDVMIAFELEPEVSVVTLFYLDRFSELSGVALTPDNWRRLAITAMMLASKVWNDDSYENAVFAQLCPAYSLDEINTFERTFLKSVGYRMSVKGSEYAKTYFFLRTLGAKDAVDFRLAPLKDGRAKQLMERCLEKQIEFRERYMEDTDQCLVMNWTL